MDESFYTDPRVFGESARPAVARRFWSRVNKNGPIVRPVLGQCWEWTGCRNQHGYGQMRIGPRGKSKAHFSHRVAWLLTYGRLPERFCLHRCDNPACVRPEHLFEGSQTENIQDMHAKGRGSFRARHGTDHHNAKLTEEQVRIIRMNTNDQRQAAKCFGVHQGTIHMIRSGKGWRTVA